MLKWVVNESHQRQSHLENVRINLGNLGEDTALRQNYETRRSLSNASIQTKTLKEEKLRRRSSVQEVGNIQRKFFIRNKENNLTSTPLALTKQITSPLRKLDSLKDLSTITPGKLAVTPLHTPTFFKDTSIAETDLVSPKINIHAQYASTLPTFDVEYSPCGIIPGPIIAFRGIGIDDSYFDKSELLPHEFPGYRKREATCQNDLLNISLQQRIKRFKSDISESKTLGIEDESLSSSRMGDITLDKMIDAILESARKERRPPKFRQNTFKIMSPTYTPADDPASDLNECWDSINLKYRQNEANFQTNNGSDPGGGVEKSSTYNEREVRTPEDCLVQSSEIGELSCYLKRQKAVRRKRKLSIASTVKSSAQRFFLNNSSVRKNLDIVVENSPDKNQLSPDSGRNSPSDLEESLETNYSKKRLTFSPVKLI